MSHRDIEQYVIVRDLEEDADLVTSSENVDLYATSTDIYFNDRDSSVRWGNNHELANGYRDLCRSNSDIPRLRDIGFLFELTWSVSNFWLWKYTNDQVLAPRTIEEVSELSYTEDYDYPADRVGIAQDILEYITDNDQVKNTILQSRNRRLDEDSIVDKVRILEIGNYEGTYDLEDGLFTQDNRERFVADSEDFDWVDDPNEYIDNKFNEVEDREGNFVVAGDIKPKVRGLEDLFSIDKRYTLELSKVIELGSWRDDIKLEHETDYETGQIVVTISKN